MKKLTLAAILSIASVGRAWSTCQTLSLTDTSKVSKTGDTMNGDLILSGPTTDLVVGGSGHFEGSLTGASSATINGSVQIKGPNPWVDVRAYGATGDGSTNDTSAINSAISANPGKVIFFPSGTYSYQGSMAIPSSTTILGAGRDITILKLPSGTATGTKMMKNSNRTSGDSRITVANMTLDLNRAVLGSSPSITGLDMYKVSFSRFENLHIMGATQHCFDFTTGNSDNLVIGNECFDYGTGLVGIGIGFVQDSHRNRIIGNYIKASNKSVGIYIDDRSGALANIPSTDNTVVGNVVENADQAIIIAGSHNNTITGNTILGVTNIGINCQASDGSDAKGNSLNSNTITLATGAIGITLGGISNVASNNTISGGATGIQVQDQLTDNFAAHSLVISGNQISTQTAYGIYIAGGRFLKISDNVIQDGVSGSLTSIAIDTSVAISTMSGISIDGNMVINSPRSALKIISGGPTMGITNVDIFNNHFINGSKEVSATYEAIVLTKQQGKLDHVSLFNNVVASTGSWVWAEGLLTSGNPTNLNLRENKFQGFTQSNEELTDRSIGCTYANGDTSPSIRNCNFMSIANTAPTTISNLTGGTTGQVVVLKFEDANTTLDRTHAFLAANKDFTSTSNGYTSSDLLTLSFHNSSWYELSRSNSISVLPSTVAYTSSANIWTADQRFGVNGTTITTSGAINMALNSAISLSTAGQGLVNLSTNALIVGQRWLQAQLPSTAAYTDAANVFTAAQRFGANGSTITNIGAITMAASAALTLGTQGQGLINLSTNALSTGQSWLPSVLPSTVVYTNAANIFTQTQLFGANGSTITSTGLFELQGGSTIATNGTLAISTSPTALTTSSGAIIINQNAGVSIFGDNNGLNAPVGYVGQYISYNPPTATAPEATNTYLSIATITLTAGDWDISGLAEWVGGGTTVATEILITISSTPTTTDTFLNNNFCQETITLGANNNFTCEIGPSRWNFTSTTAWYLMTKAKYTTLGGATWASNAAIRARRMR